MGQPTRDVDSQHIDTVMRRCEGKELVYGFAGFLIVAGALQERSRNQAAH